MTDHIREAVEAALYPGDGADPDEVEAAVRAALARRKARAETEPAKTCPACGERLPAAAFGRNMARPDGLAACCKACEATRQQAVRQARRST